MRVAMSHALVKKTFQMDACIHPGMSFFCKHTANAATTRNAKHSEFVGMAYLQRDMSKTRMTSHSYPERTLWESMQRRSEIGNRVPSVDTFVLLSEFFGVTLDYLVLGKAH